MNSSRSNGTVDKGAARLIAALSVLGLSLGVGGALSPAAAEPPPSPGGPTSGGGPANGGNGGSAWGGSNQGGSPWATPAVSAAGAASNQMKWGESAAGEAGCGGSMICALELGPRDQVMLSRIAAQAGMTSGQIKTSSQLKTSSQQKIGSIQVTLAQAPTPELTQWAASGARRPEVIIAISKTTSGGAQEQVIVYKLHDVLLTSLSGNNAELSYGAIQVENGGQGSPAQQQRIHWDQKTNKSS